MNRKVYANHESTWKHTGVQSAAEVELVRAKKTIEQFIYSCSHTMRGPLKSISGLIYLLRSSDSQPEINSDYYLKSIEHTVAKLEALLNDLEQFLNNMNGGIAAKSINPKDLVKQVLGDFKESIERFKINVRVTVRQKAPLRTDDNLLRVVLSHLVSNAVSYHDPKKKKRLIRISICIDNKRCVLRVTDNGIGMRDEIRQKVFQLFFRGNSKTHGTGVGLYIAREIVTKMEGAITVTSRPGSGSCFSVAIPNLVVDSIAAHASNHRNYE